MWKGITNSQGLPSPLGKSDQILATTAKVDVATSTSMAPDTDRPRRPQKRVITEARREQNRVNQRTYRKCSFFKPLSIT
jgi:hypothetical protein